MTAPLLLQYTSIRTHVADDKVLIGLKHTYKDDAGQELKTEWIEMPPEDAASLVKTLQAALDELGTFKPGTKWPMKTGGRVRPRK